MNEGESRLKTSSAKRQNKRIRANKYWSHRKNAGLEEKSENSGLIVVHYATRKQFVRP